MHLFSRRAICIRADNDLDFFAHTPDRVRQSSSTVTPMKIPSLLTRFIWRPCIESQQKPPNLGTLGPNRPRNDGAEDMSATVRVGDFLGKYELVGEIGHGA